MILSLQEQLTELKQRFNKTTSMDIQQKRIIKTKNISIINFIEENKLTDKLHLYNKTKEIFTHLEIKHKQSTKFKSLILTPKLLTLGTYNRMYIDKEENERIADNIKAFIIKILSIFLQNTKEQDSFKLLYFHLISFFEVNFFETRFLINLSLIVPEGEIKDVIANSLEFTEEEFLFMKKRMEEIEGTNVYFDPKEIANVSIKHPILLKEIKGISSFINQEIEDIETDAKIIVKNNIDTFINDLKSELRNIVKAKKLNSNVIFKINSFITNI